MRGWSQVIGVALFLGGLSGQEAVFKASVSLVAVKAQVLGNHGVVQGLTKSDFNVLDNGEPQEVVSVALDRAQLDIVLLFDVSTSMGPAVSGVAASIDKAFGELKTGDRVAAMAFNTKSWLVFPLTEDLHLAAAELRTRIANTEFLGGTYIQNAVDDAAAYLRRQPALPGRQRTVIVISDNDGYGPNFQKGIVTRLWDSDITVNALIAVSAETLSSRLGLHGAERMNSPDDVNPLADQTGGIVIDATQPGDSLDEMFRRIRQRYVIYYHLPLDKPGRHRNVSVSLSLAAQSRFPSVSVIAKKGYRVPRPQ